MSLVVPLPLNGGYAVVTVAPKAAPAAPSAPVQKVSGPAETTVGPKGLIVARFAKLDAIDADGDVTVTGAVGSGQDVLISQWQHASWQPGFLPVGKGRVTEEAGFLVLRGQFFMDTIAGRETFHTLVGLGAQTEYSYGFQIAQADRGRFGGEPVRFLRKLLISEVSPVLRGAGVATGTVQLSSVDPLQLEIAAAVRENERRLRKLAGFAPARRPVPRANGTYAIAGFHNGDPIYVTGGRK